MASPRRGMGDFIKAQQTAVEEEAGQGREETPAGTQEAPKAPEARTEGQATASRERTPQRRTEAPPPRRRERKPAARLARPKVEVEEGPKWQRYERKEVFFRPGQLTSITELRRELNRERGRGRGERITDNTLVRVAVDLLLAHADQVRGITEEELRDSVTPGVRKARRPG